jgi:hypothetical protein
MEGSRSENPTKHGRSTSISMPRREKAAQIASEQALLMR